MSENAPVFPTLAPSLQRCVVGVCERGIRRGRIDGVGAWHPEVRAAIEERLFDMGYACYAAGRDRLVVPMEWKGETSK